MFATLIILYIIWGLFISVVNIYKPFAADITNPKEIDLTKDHIFSPSCNIGGYCLMGKIPLNFLHLSWEKSPNLSLGERVELVKTVSMQSCFMKVTFLSIFDKKRVVTLKNENEILVCMLLLNLICYAVEFFR